MLEVMINAGQRVGKGEEVHLFVIILCIYCVMGGLCGKNIFCL